MLIVLAAAAAAAATPLPPRPMRHFGDWTVGCDNGRKCQAVALQAQDSPADEKPPFWTLSAEREAQSARPVIAVEAAFDEVSLASRLVADGKPTQFRFDGNGALVAGPDPLQLLRTIARARKLSFVDAAGKTVGRLSPLGATAALRWMDEQQRRAGTTNAIVALGTRAAPPLAVRLPGILVPPSSEKPPRRLAAAEVVKIRKRYACDRPPDDPVTAYRLDARHSLAIVPCMLHAYQSSSIVLVLPDGSPWRPVPLARPFAENPDETPEWMTEPEFDAASRSLWTHYKGRGLGDCGGSENYIWDGRRMRLAYLDAMDRCGGSRARITLWRTANRPGQ